MKPGSLHVQVHAVKHASPSAAGSAASIASMQAIAPAAEVTGAPWAGLSG